jgi:F0F1-type ATP synthase alpha subunit
VREQRHIDAAIKERKERTNALRQEENEIYIHSVSDQIITLSGNDK